MHCSISIPENFTTPEGQCPQISKTRVQFCLILKFIKIESHVGTVVFLEAKGQLNKRGILHRKLEMFTLDCLCGSARLIKFYQILHCIFLHTLRPLIKVCILLYLIQKTEKIFWFKILTVFHKTKALFWSKGQSKTQDQDQSKALASGTKSQKFTN